ncbi:MAG: hypothetical protein ACYDIB_06795, partial [Desulfobulbia bacterium]
MEPSRREWAGLREDGHHHQAFPSFAKKPNKKKIYPGIAEKEAVKSVRLFLCLPKKRTSSEAAKKGRPGTCPADGGMPGVY